MTFQNLTSGRLAHEQAGAHEAICKGNPENRCQFCEGAFPGRNVLLDHLSRCIKKYHYEVNNYRESCNRYYCYDFVPSTEAPYSSSPGMNSNWERVSYNTAPNISAGREQSDHMQRYVNSTIASIELKLQEYENGGERSEGLLRRKLRKLLLVWHPDKAKRGNSEENWFVTEVFKYVNQRWQKANANK